MRGSLKSLILAGCLTFLYGIYYWGIPAIVNLPARVDLIKSAARAEGYNIELKNPELKMGLRPAVIIKADYFALLNDDNSKALEIERPYLKAAILPFIFKKAVIRDFEAENINAQIIYDKTLKLGQYPINMEQKQPVKLQYAKAKLNGYSIHMSDLNNGKKVDLCGQYLTLENFNPDKELEMSTIADIKTETHNSKISVDIKTKLPLNKISGDNLNLEGQIVNLNLDDFTPYAKVISKDKIQALSGVVNSTARTMTNGKQKNIHLYSEIRDLNVQERESAANITYKDKLKLNSQLFILNNGVEIREMSLSGEKINTAISGKITKLTSKFPMLDLDVKINNTRTENIIPLLPGIEDLVGEINLLTLKKTGFWGNIQGNLNIKGKADFPDVTGNITVTDGYLLQPIPNSPKATIKLDFIGQKLILDAHVPTTPVEYVDVKGPIELYRQRNADLKITSTKHVDLQTAEIVLNPLHEILKFDLGPVPVMDIHGKGNIDLHVSGNKKDPHAWGQFNFYDTTASFIEIHNMTLKNGKGKLTFDDVDTHFVTESATLNGKPVTVDGKCNLQGVLDFDITANNQNIKDLVKIIRTSPMLADIQKMIAPIQNAEGNANLQLKLTGKVKDPKDIVFNKNIFAKGKLELLSDSIRIQGMPFDLKNVTGNAKFENTKVILDLVSSINNSKISVAGTIDNDRANLTIASNRLVLNDLISSMQDIKLPYREDLTKIVSSFTANYSGTLTPINYNAITMKGKVYPHRGNNLSINGGNFELRNSVFKLSPLSGKFKSSPYKISAQINKTFDKSPVINGAFDINNFNINYLDDKKLRDVLPADLAKQLENFSDYRGIINFSCKIKNNNLRAYSRLNDISLTYLPSHVKFVITSGNIFLNNSTVHLNKINSRFGEMPLLIDGRVNNIFSKNPDLNIYVNAKPTQEFFDQFFNNKALYPIKLKGDIRLSSRLTGRPDKLRVKTELNMDENSSLYYMGASIGDSQNPVSINLDSTLTPNSVVLRHFQYDKTISSQNNRPFVNPQLNVSGTIKYLPDNNAEFRNLKIKTQTPTDAKIFNIIFRKPIMKQGVFTSDLILNGTTLNPIVRGKLEVTSIDIPFFDSTIKDISLEFKPDKIYVHSRGVVLTNNIILDAVAQNKLIPPYVIEDVNLKLADLDINKITATLRDMEAEASTRTKSSTGGIPAFDITQLILKNADITANTISVRNIRANNLEAQMSLDEKMLLDINKFKFNIAEGTVDGNFKNNLLTRAIDLNLNLDRANAQMMTEALFDLKGQIYGSMTGNVNLKCNGTSYEKCMQTIRGSGKFIVSDGKMPKLGSLEYLLKAGNLLRGGFMGLSINSIIDFITPLKTGEFNSISGDMKINNGIINPINIYSDGKDLNMYLTGSYNVVTSLADMRIFGSLSKNVTNVFGKIKNASLNTLLNTIPGINRLEEPSEFQADIEKIPNIQNSESISRFFNAEIYGDINGDNYVKSFRWIK